MPSLDAILRANPDFVDDLYRRWLDDPQSVDRSWALFFEGMRYAGNGTAAPAGRRAAVEGEPIVLTARGALPEGVPEETVAPALRIYDVVYTYRAFGHLIADLDPLGSGQREHPLLALSEFGFSEDDLDQVEQRVADRGRDETAAPQVDQAPERAVRRGAGAHLSRSLDALASRNIDSRSW